jgi:predicted nucleic acid-binding Zn ribbon protein
VPTYTYKCDRCECEQLYTHGMAENPAVPCTVCANPCHIVIRALVPVKVRQALKGTEYREDLARFSNDPRAWVDGPRALKKLIDQTKREGASVRDLSDVSAPPEDPEDLDVDLVMEAQQEAIDSINRGEEN